MKFGAFLMAGGTPKWMVYNGKSSWHGWFGCTRILGNLSFELQAALGRVNLAAHKQRQIWVLDLESSGNTLRGIEGAWWHPAKYCDILCMLYPCEILMSLHFFTLKKQKKRWFYYWTESEQSHLLGSMLDCRESAWDSCICLLLCSLSPFWCSILISQLCTCWKHPIKVPRLETIMFEMCWILVVYPSILMTFPDKFL